MQLYYSGAYAAGKPQTEGTKSLGGYPSTTLIPNGGLNNVFDPITRSYVKGMIPSIRLIVLKNTTGSTVNDISIYTMSGDLATYKIAAVAPTVDSCGNKVFESIPDGNTLPYQAILETHEGSGQAETVDTLAANDLIGIWIERDLTPDAYTELDGKTGAPSLDCDTLATLLEAQQSQPITYEQGQLIVSWS